MITMASIARFPVSIPSISVRRVSLLVTVVIQFYLQMKDGKKPGKVIELTTSAQIAAWRQRLDTEGKICQHRNHTEIEKMQDQLDSKNTYMNYFKKDEVKEREEIQGRNKTYFIYDTAKGDTEQNYCQKCKYESKWCKHRKEREVAKQMLGAALTTTQQYGWRAPIDDFSSLGKSRVAICKRTFFDVGHL